MQKNICLIGQEHDSDLARSFSGSEHWLLFLFWLKNRCRPQKSSGMFTGIVETPTGPVRQVSTRLNRSDFWGAVKVRWLINRDNYKVEPGLYGVGNPDNNSDVFVTANYKLSFDHLRRNLDGINGWILVLNTKGVNVWCAAGKGTFGTHELANRIRETRLERIINHRRLIVPQLGATGISAHQLKELTSEPEDNHPTLSIQPSGTPSFVVVPQLSINKGFTVKFGPVRAGDIKAYIANGYKTTPAMRRVEFPLSDRMRLVPVDLVYNKYKLLLACLLIIILYGIKPNGYSLASALSNGQRGIVNLLIAYFSGLVLFPMLLPWLPFRMFSFKGLILGFATTALLLLTTLIGDNLLEKVSWFLLLPAISSFLAMNFTGASTFTSLTGVKKEMRIFVPIQIILASAGLGLFVLNLIIRK